MTEYDTLYERAYYAVRDALSDVPLTNLLLLSRETDGWNALVREALQDEIEHRAS